MTANDGKPPISRDLAITFNLESIEFWSWMWTPEKIEAGIKVVERLRQLPELRRFEKTPTHSDKEELPWYQLRSILNGLGWRPVADEINFRLCLEYPHNYKYCIKCGLTDEANKAKGDSYYVPEKPVNINGNPCCPRCRSVLTSWGQFIVEMPQ